MRAAAALPQTEAERHVGTLTLLRVFFRSFFLQAAWNPRGMQNLGFAYAMEPALQRLYPDPAERARATARHLEFFNCHPYAAAAIVGGAVRLEERAAAGEIPGEEVATFKRALGPPLAALGDGFFWLALRPASALAAAMAVPFLGLWSLAMFLGIYNFIHLVVRGWLFAQGYRLGEGVVQAIGEAHVPRGTGLLKLAGAVLAGALAARSILAAGLPDRPRHGLLVALAVLGFFYALPRLGLLRAMYVALVAGIALGALIL